MNISVMLNNPFFWVFLLSLHFYISYSLFLIVRKVGKANLWQVWIPFFNLQIAVKAAGRPGWQVLLFFVPVYNFVFWVFIVLETTKKLKKSESLAILALIPLFNYFIPAILSLPDKDSPAREKIILSLFTFLPLLLFMVFILKK